MKQILSFIVVFFTGFGLLLARETPKVQLKPGDILFREAVTESLSEAIDKVTQTSAETHFSHVGLVDRHKGRLVVLHASPDGGSCRISITEFLHPKDKAVKVIAYRLSKTWQKTIPAALKAAREMLGKPYNFTYVMNDSSYYCSDFVYRAFAFDSIFTLNPMTFKDPSTGQFFPTWIEYYRKQGIDIPEGKPGCNPNGLAASDKLIRLGEIR